MRTPLLALAIALASWAAAGCGPSGDAALRFELLFPDGLLDEVDHFDLRVWSATDASCNGAVVVAGSAPPVAEQAGILGATTHLTLAAGATVFAVAGFADAAGSVQIAQGCQAATLQRDVPAAVTLKIVRVGSPPERVVFASNAAGPGQTALYIVDPTVGNQARRITQTPLVGSGSDWDLVGETAVFDAVSGGPYEIFSARIDGAVADQAVNLDGPASDCALSPDGQRVAYATRASGTSQIVVADLGGSTRTAISTGNVDASAPAWSRDGALLAWLAGGKLWLGAPAGGKPKLLSTPTVSDGAAPVWTFDGRIVTPVTATGGEDLVAWDPSSDKLSATLARRLAGIHAVAIAPTGSAVLFVVAGGAGDIWQADLAGAIPAAPLIASAADEDFPAWSSDGKRIAYTINKLVFTANPNASGAKRLTATAANFAEVRPRFASPASM